MAKYKQNAKNSSARVKEIKTPSFYGSHKTMVVEELDDGFVICEDEFGKYKTHSSVLDNGLADPNRNGNRRG